MMTFDAPLVMYMPLPLMTPELPTPTILLLLPTLIGSLAAFGEVQETQVLLQVSWIQYCPLG
jgi:hypothetical protein